MVTKFYSKLDGAEDASDGGNPPPPTIDSQLLELVWKWLVANPEIFLGESSNGNKLTFAEAETLAASAVGENDDTTSASPSGAGKSKKGEKDAPIRNPSRLYVSENRQWDALTGHGIDWKRVPRLEFQLLSIIAEHGENGITQPDLIRLSGQDKRSVPKRTDNLHHKGYIVKRGVYAAKAKTSLCTFKRFAKEISLAKKAPESTAVATAASIFDGRFDSHKFIDYVHRTLKDRDLMLIDELYKDLVRTLEHITVAWILIPKLGYKCQSLGDQTSPQSARKASNNWSRG